jgi:hypothetical protein
MELKLIRYGEINGRHRGILIGKKDCPCLFSEGRH